MFVIKEFQKSVKVNSNISNYNVPKEISNTLKLINNFFAMTTACAMSEAFAMADLAGLERSTLYEVMSAGPLKSGMMDFIKAGAIDGDPRQLAEETFTPENASRWNPRAGSVLADAPRVASRQRERRVARGTEGLARWKPGR